MKAVKKVLFICMILAIVILSFSLIKEKKDFENKCNIENKCISKNEEEPKEIYYNCSFTQTWKVIDLLDSFKGHHPDINFVIVDKFQFFEPYSHIIPSNLKTKLEVGKYYEFTYTIQGKGYIEDFNDVIKNIKPENVQLDDQNSIKVNLSIKETDKIGLDQLQEPICQSSSQ